MNPRARLILFVLLGVAMLALAVGWWWTTFERKQTTVTLPPTGEARTNPLYGLKTALLASGQRVDARARLALARHPLGARDTLLMIGNTSAVPDRDADAVLAWVERGGHLVVLMNRFESARVLGGRVPVRLKTVEAEDIGCAEVVPATRGADKTHMICAARFALTGAPAVAASWQDDDGYVFARLPRGRGSIDVVAQQHFVLADALHHYDAYAEFVRQLLAPNWNAGTFHLVYAADVPPLWRLLLDQAWMVLVPLMLLLFAWLWMRMQRFGPLLPSPEGERRSLLEHVQASGQHLHRYGRAHLLHSALRARVLARLRRRDPVAAALEGSTQAVAVSQRTGLPASHVTEALQMPRPLDDKDFRHRIARLIALGRHL